MCSQGAHEETTVKNDILEIFKQSIRLKEDFVQRELDALDQVIHTTAGAFGRGNKILLFGNGGSAADAQHIAAEFVNRYLMDRPPLPALALTTDTSVLTSIANDFSYETVFEKQIKALGHQGDVAFGISTSGESRNVVLGLKVAREMGLMTVGLGGPAGSSMERECHHYLAVDGAPTPRIQEVHVVIGHTLVEIVDRILFGGASTRSAG
jgi:D-sedoheptulose 7-phosphate isomerase